MLAGILLLAFVSLLGILSHRQSRLEKKVLKNIPLIDWIMIMGIPVGIFAGWYILTGNILDREKIPFIPMDDFDILAALTLFMIYVAIGLGVHFTAKVLWRYLSADDKSDAHKINEMLHNKFSHYMAYFNGFFAIFMLCVLEINHPLNSPMFSSNIILIILAGIICGFSLCKMILYTNEWFGGYNKPLVFLVFILLGLILNISRVLKLNNSYYPVKLFITTVFASFLISFAIRQVLIFTRLGHKRRLRFLAKILSV